MQVVGVDIRRRLGGVVGQSAALGTAGVEVTTVRSVK